MPGVLNLINVAFVSEPTYVSFTKLVYYFRVTAQVSRLHKTTDEITIIINEAYYEIKKGKTGVIFGSCEMPRHVLLSVVVSACNSATSTGGIFVKFFIPVLLKFVCLFLC